MIKETGNFKSCIIYQSTNISRGYGPSSVETDDQLERGLFHDPWWVGLAETSLYSLRSYGLFLLT